MSFCFVQHFFLHLQLFVGYTVTEARISLRACAGNINDAISYILEKRETRQKARARGRKEYSLTKKIGKTKDETWVNPRTLNVLVEMGFDKDLCAMALRKTNNDLGQSVKI